MGKQPTKHQEDMYPSATLTSKLLLTYQDTSLKKYSNTNDPEYTSAYQSIDPLTGKYSDSGICLREPEKPLMSRRPGIGYPFYKKFHSDMYRMDGDCIHDLEGRKFPIPHYYDTKFKSDFPLEYEENQKPT